MVSSAPSTGATTVPCHSTFRGHFEVFRQQGSGFGRRRLFQNTSTEISKCPGGSPGDPPGSPGDLRGPSLMSWGPSQGPLAWGPSLLPLGPSVILNHAFGTQPGSPGDSPPSYLWDPQKLGRVPWGPFGDPPGDLSCLWGPSMLSQGSSILVCRLCDSIGDSLTIILMFLPVKSGGSP